MALGMGFGVVGSATARASQLVLPITIGMTEVFELIAIQLFVTAAS